MTPPLTETWCYWCCALNTRRKFFQFLSGTATSDFSYHTRFILPPVFPAMVDVIFADVAQPDQARIVSINAQHFLKNQGNFVISIKVCLSVCLSVCLAGLSVHAGSHILCSHYLFTTLFLYLHYSSFNLPLDMHCSLPSFSYEISICNVLVHDIGLFYMWQFRAEIKDYSITYFDCITVFEAPYH